MTGTAAANAWATPTASWPVIASTTRSVSIGLTAALTAAISCHQRLVDAEAAGGVEDHDVADLALGRLDALPGDVRDRGAGRRAEDRDVELLAERLELVRGGRAVRVGGDEERSTALLDDVARELGRAGGLAGALQADHRDDGGVAAAGGTTRSPVPSSSTSSSWTIFTTCWPAVRLCRTSAPMAFSRTRATKSLTTLKLTSASSSARRTSRMAASTSASLIRPRPVRLPSVARRRSLRVSNTVRLRTP